MSGTGTISIVEAVLVGGRLRLVAAAPPAPAAAALPTQATITDFFGRSYQARLVTAPDAAAAAGPEHLHIEALLPAVPPNADAPSYLLTIGGLSAWFAPAASGSLAPTAGDAAAAAPAGRAGIDYTGRDYSALTTMMSARIARQIGAGAAQALAHPADPLTTLIELLAYAGDHLAYRQDAAGTESYLMTARHRLSLRRHARLRDYAVNDGANARTVLVFTVSADTLLPAGLAAVTYQPGRLALNLPAATALAPATTLFETMAPLPATVALNDLGPRLAAPATLPVGTISCALTGDDPGLRAGQLLVLQQSAAPAGGAAFGAQALRLLKVESVQGAQGQALTLIAWHPEDALARPLTVPSAGQPGAVSLFANVVLADHGLSVAVTPVPDVAPAGAPYRPTVALADPLRAAPLPAAAPGFDGTQDLVAASLLVASARAALNPDPRAASPCLTMIGRRPGMSVGTPPHVTGVTDLWTARDDLLDTPPSGMSFAVAATRRDDGTPLWALRFGGDGMGCAPPPGTVFAAQARDGGGQSGRVQAGALRQVIGAPASVVGVSNPLAAMPAAAESDAAIRLFAAHAFQTNRRGVDPADWQRLGADDPLVVELRAQSPAASAGPCHIGLGTAVPEPVTYPVAAQRLLDYAILGAPPAIAPGIDIALNIVMVVYARAGADIPATRARLLQRCGAGRLPDGAPAFFNADLWPLGRPVKLDELVATLRADREVAQVVTDPRIEPRLRFETCDTPGLTPDNIARGMIALRPCERARIGNDPFSAAQGSFRLLVVAAP